MFEIWRIEKMNRLESAAKTALINCMGTKKGEKVLVVTDNTLCELGLIFYQAAVKLEAEAMLIQMIPRTSNGEEPPGVIAAAMKEADVVLLVTEKSLSHTRARKKSNEAGARVASLPGLNADMMARTLSADYSAISRLSKQIGDILTEGHRARLTSHAGTNLVLSIEGRKGHPDTGIYHQKGAFGNLPAGESFIAPVEETASGIIVFDGSLAGVGKLEEPITLQVEKGYVVDISGGNSARELIELLSIHGKNGRNIAELGIGTNHEARLTGLVLEDEKVLGTVHVALGDNSTFGGTVEAASHLDGIILYPTLEIDGHVLLKDGKMLVD
jgi:leucyl aminopeptidase (aminopeptidase T)